jgi:hypothetical protein
LEWKDIFIFRKIQITKKRPLGDDPGLGVGISEDIHVRPPLKKRSLQQMVDTD